MRIAIVGSGISGNAAAWALSATHEVTVYEQGLKPGGHSNTVDVLAGDGLVAVDTGFIVFNERNYPELTALFAHLGVETVPSAMSFSVSAEDGRLEWAGGGRSLAETLDGLFAQRSNLASPAYWSMLAGIVRFGREAVADRAAGRLAGLSLGDYLALRCFPERLARDYLIPMGAAIWSTPAEAMLDFPADRFVAFFDNHRLLSWDRPVWRTVKGGSRDYVERLVAPFRHRILLGTQVTALVRTEAGVEIIDARGGRAEFDQAILATHSDQALALLSDPDEAEQAVLAAVPYRPNRVFLHCDPRLMPRRRRAWSAWNFLRWQGSGRRPGEAGDGSEPADVAVTYWMNPLQGLVTPDPVFVSLNPPFEPQPEATYASFDYDHPQFGAASSGLAERLAEVQGRRRVWFCGAWTGYGFHEDGLRSGLDVAEALGGSVPWRRRTAFTEAAE